MEIKLDAETVAGIASAAIFDSLTEEMRESVIKQAIQGLMTPEKERFGTGKTPLQNAFDAAIRDASFKIVREKIAEDPQISEAILELLGPLLNAALESEAKTYTYSLADALGTALGNWLATQSGKER